MLHRPPIITMKKFLRATVVLVCVWLACATLFLFTNIPYMFTTDPRLHPGSRLGMLVKTLRPWRGNVTRNITPTEKKLVLPEDHMKYQPRIKEPDATPINATSLAKPELKFIKGPDDEEIENSGPLSDKEVKIVKKNIQVSKLFASFRPPARDLGKLPDINDKISVVHMRQEAAEKRYYTIGKSKINPIDHDYIISGGQICDAEAPFLLIMVPSIPSHFNVRDVIRNTYGAFARDDGTVHRKTNSTLTETVKIMFLLGRDGNENTDRLILNESRTHGDIVHVDFRESYYNLTRKMLITLKWIAMYCSEVDYFLKADEDVFVNVPVLVRRLKRRPFGIKGAIYGHINKRSAVKRTGKWAVGWKEFPLLFYPVYASGNSYVISGNIVPRMFMVSEYFPYMPIEDAFITGILARVVEATHVDMLGFTYWEDGEPDPCGFVRESRISATKITETLMKKLWLASQNFDKHCRYTVQTF